jgi:hypothetical protein
LALLVSTGLSSCIDAFVFFPPKVIFEIFEGDFKLVVVRVSGYAKFHSEFYLWTPKFGSQPALTTDAVRTTLCVPIWLCVLLLLSWLAFREWRRYRRARGGGGTGAGAV